MKETLIIIGIIAIIIITCIAHERDIARTIKEKGDSGYAGWTVKIKGEVIEK